MSAEPTTTSTVPKPSVIVPVASGLNLFLMLGGIVSIVLGFGGTNMVDRVSYILTGIIALLTGWNNRQFLNSKDAPKKPSAVFNIMNILLLVVGAVGIVRSTFVPNGIVLMATSLLFICGPGLLSLIAARRLSRPG